MSQPQPRHLSRSDDMHLLQQQIMFKQMQELQKRQQLQELGDARQQNYKRQLAAINKQVDGGRFPVIDGVPIHSASEMPMVGDVNLVHHGASPAIEGFPNRLVHLQTQGQDVLSMKLDPQQLDVSLYGTPIATARNNLIQCSHLQGISHDSTNMFDQNRYNQEKYPMQSSAFLSFLSDPLCVSSDQISMADRAFISKPAGCGKSLFRPIPTHGLNSGVLPGKFQPVSTQKTNASQHELSGRKEQVCRSGAFMQNTTKVGQSKTSATLDPLERKILFSIDDNNWNGSSGMCANMSTGDFSNVSECTDYLSLFPSIQSGSWSALMQSAVAETSRNDTEVQEQWSGLSSQNKEPSTDNQPSSFISGGNRQTIWFDNRVQSASTLCSKALFNDSTISSIFPGFQQSDILLSIKQRGAECSNNSHGSTQWSSKSASGQLCSDSEQNLPIVGGQPVRTIQPLENAWTGNNDAAVSFSNTVGGLNQLKSVVDDKMVEREYPQSNKFMPNSSMIQVDHETNRHVTENHMHEYLKQVTPLKNKGREVMQEGRSEPSNTLKLIVDSYKEAGETYEKQGNCYQREHSSNSYNSRASQHTNSGHELRENVWQQASVHQSMVGGRQKSFAQILCQQITRGSDAPGKDHFEALKFVGNVPNGEVNLEKVESPDGQRSKKAPTEVLNGGNAGAGFSSLANRSVDLNGSNTTAWAGHNMLEFLPKIDHEKEHSTAEHADSNGGRSISQQYDNSFTSECFGLRLSPPFQWVSNSNLSFRSQDASQTAIAAYPSSPHSRNQPKRQHLPAAQATLSAMASRLSHYKHATSQDPFCLSSPNNFGPQFPISETVPVTQSSFKLGRPQQIVFPIKPSQARTDFSAQYHPHITEPNKLLPSLAFSDSADNSVERKWTSQQPHGQYSYKRGITSTDGECLVNSKGLNCGEEQLVVERSLCQISSDIVDPAYKKDGQELLSKHLSETDATSSSSMMTHSHQHDFGRAQHGAEQAQVVSARVDACGHSLKLSSLHGQNHSLLCQLGSLKNVKADLNKRVSEEHNGTGPDLNLQEVTAVAVNQLMHEHNSDVKIPVIGELSVASHLNSFVSRNKILHSLSEVREDQPVKDSFHLEDTSQQMFTTSQNDSPSQSINSNTATNGMESSQIGLQQASPWFKQFKNGLIEQHLELTNQNFAVTGAKKRKITSPKLLPWHKEVTQGSWKLKNVSMAELEWTQATNRLIEKAEGTTEIRNVQLMLQPKKRLILTTKLMQQVFEPPPAAVLAAEATSNFESVMYFLARRVLGDACSLTSCSRSHSSPYPKPYVMMPENSHNSERWGELHCSEIGEDFTKRAKKLEIDLLRLECKASILDLRVESQELERISTLNRFAKFHTHGQANSASASSTANRQQTFPRRYVTALPMPQAIPEGGNCLSL